jgi:hypothetical protein
MKKVTYEIKEHYNGMDRYWTGEGFSYYEKAAFEFIDINDATNVASCLLAINKIQDGDKRPMKYFILTIVDDLVRNYTEVKL